MLILRNFLLLFFVDAKVCLGFSGYLSSITTDHHAPVAIGSNVPDSAVGTIEAKLYSATEKFMNEQGGYFSPLASDRLSDDFVYRGPIVGPLNKLDYIEVLDYFKIYEAFPDIQPNCYGFSTDPNEPLKVRFFIKATGTYQNPIGGLLGKIIKKRNAPDGRDYKGSTEAWSITFNDEKRMQVKCITAGYVVDRFEEGTTTDGKGLAVGIFNTVGISSQSNPGSKRLRFTQWLTNKFSKGPNAKFPKSFSDPKTIPEWWTDSRIGADK